LQNVVVVNKTLPARYEDSGVEAQGLTVRTINRAAEGFAPSKRQGTLSETTVSNKPVCLTQAGVSRYFRPLHGRPGHDFFLIFRHWARGRGGVIPFVSTACFCRAAKNSLGEPYRLNQNAQ